MISCFVVLIGVLGAADFDTPDAVVGAAASQQDEQKQSVPEMHAAEAPSTRAAPEHQDEPAEEPHASEHQEHEKHEDALQSAAPADERMPDGKAQDRHGRWRLGANGGVQAVLTRRAEWVAASGSKSFAGLFLQRELADLLFAGLHAHLGVTYRPARSEPGMALLEGQLGLGYDVLPRGIQDMIFPYLRVDLLLGRATMRFDEHRGQGTTLGVNGTAGLRFGLPRMGRKRINRLFLLVEGGYEARRDQAFYLEPQNGQDLLPGPKTSLGTVNLSGYAWRVGGGLHF